MHKSVIVADDSKEMRDTLSLAIEGVETTIFQADNGKTALDLLKLHHIDFLILDLVMPEKEGIETIREVSALYPEVKIIAISAYDNYLKIAESFNIFATFSKPLDINSLLSRLN